MCLPAWRARVPAARWTRDREMQELFDIQLRRRSHLVDEESLWASIELGGALRGSLGEFSVADFLRTSHFIATPTLRVLLDLPWRSVLIPMDA